MNKRRWLWVLLFVSLAVLLGTLATGWNVVLVRDYLKMAELARSMTNSPHTAEAPWIGVIFGTLGFIAALAIIVLIFIKLLNEMGLNQLQSEFLATVTHELKTPIASMELTSSLIRAGGLSAEEIDRLWHSHQSELARLRSEVESLLEAARWQGRPVAIKKEPIHLESWITQSFERWKSLLGPGSAVVRAGDPLDTEAKLDVRMLNLIADNLVDNSRKFSGGNPRLTIVTRTLPSGPFKKPRWQISFQDHGCGFDPADSRRIFTRFFRGRTGSAGAIPGTGLGLYIARSASKALGLHLKGHSAGIGAGAVFTIEGTSTPEAIPS